jgi:glutathione S-transferase
MGLGAYPQQHDLNVATDMTQPMTIYGDSTSGNSDKVKFVCDRLNIPYRWIEISAFRKETRTPEFLAINPAGQVPVIVTPDNRPLAQSNAIMLYLADGSALMPADAFQRALVFQWLFWEQYSHEPAVAVRIFQKVQLKKADHDINPDLLTKSEAALTVMEGHLASRAYFVGDSLTLADIALVAYTRKSHLGGLDLTRWPQVQAWVGRVENDLKIAPVPH